MKKFLKWMFILGGGFIAIIIVIVIIAAVVGGGGDNDDESTPTLSGRAPETTATPRAGFAKVGSIEIQILSIETFDATPYNIFNDENLRIHVRVQKVSGDEYDFALNEWTLVTSGGVGIERSLFCADCPDRIQDLVIYGDQPIEAYVYFEFSAGTHTLTELRYEPTFSFSKGTIPLDYTVTIR